MKTERLQAILEELNQRRILSTEDAMVRFGASAATLRRDFNELTRSGLVRRVHGGVRALDGEREVPSIPFGLREEWNGHEKQLLAQRAAAYIQAGQSLIVYGGSTTCHLGEFLNHGTVVTNLPALCPQLIARFPTGSGPQVVLTGGSLDYRTGLLLGPAVRNTLDAYECDWGICSAFGMDEQGLGDIDDECADLIARMMSRARKTIVLADHTKFGRRGFRRCLDWNMVDFLLTTFDPAHHAIFQAARKQGVQVEFVPFPDAEKPSRPSSAH